MLVAFALIGVEPTQASGAEPIEAARAPGLFEETITAAITAGLDALAKAKATKRLRELRRFPRHRHPRPRWTPCSIKLDPACLTNALC